MIPKGTSFQRAALWSLCIILSLLAASALSISVYLRQLLEQPNYIDPNTAPTMSQEQLDAYLSTDIPELTVPSAPSIAPEKVEFQEPDATIGGSGIVNILLIGQDRWEGEKQARSDSIILCTLHKDTATLTMTSFLRDLYVQIPGYRDNRINASYAAGGMKLLTQTLEHNFGIQVDGCVEVDFTRFPQLIDLLGGVTLELRADEASAINKSVPGDLTEGTQLLNGDQALAYTRIRKLDSDGDFSRTNRQRKLLEALIDAYRDVKLTRILSLLKEATAMVTTDMEPEMLLRLAAEVIPMLPELTVHQQHIPAEGTYSYKTIRGMAVLVADMDAARQLLEKIMMQ